MLTLVMVCEAAADFRLASALIDRTLLQAHHWLEEYLEHARAWCALDENESFIAWTSIKDIAATLRIRVHGHFDNAPGESDAASARKALLAIRHQIPQADAVVLIRDRDKDGTRTIGLNQARNSLHPPPAVVIGLANRNREAWVLAGFECIDTTEQERLAALRQELGFCPCEKSHELTAQLPEHKRSSKRVLAELSGDASEREEKCWQATSLEVLRSRGQENGLAEFLAEVSQRIVPLLQRA